MNGAESLVRSLVASGLEVCFANPGTSEMHFVAALDKVSGLRCILGLHETVVTGAADGYARMARNPAAALLHTGPGLANGLSNLHNARKARTPVVNIVGEHALAHIQHDAPLTSDIQAIAAPMSHWVQTPTDSDSLASAGSEAVREAKRFPGQVATLILPADTAWNAVNDVSAPTPSGTPQSIESAGEPVSQSAIADIAQILKEAKDKQEPVCFILGGHCLDASALEEADKIAQVLDATLFAETFNGRLQRGAGRVAVPEVPYPVAQAIEVLSPFRHVVTVAAKAPVGFFAYPDKPSTLYDDSAQVHKLASAQQDGIKALQDLARALNATSCTPRLQQRKMQEEPANASLTAEAIGILVANHLPDQAIIVDESITCGASLFNSLTCAQAHDWLEICGGSIGGGIPLATGAAVACPQRQVVGLQADGSGMYSIQGLWTQAREKLNVVTIILANSSYAILKHELDNVQAQSGRVALDMMELDRPRLDWVAMSTGMGVTARRAATVDEFRAALQEALSYQGPFLIEAVIP